MAPGVRENGLRGNAVERGPAKGPASASGFQRSRAAVSPSLVIGALPLLVEFLSFASLHNFPVATVFSLAAIAASVLSGVMAVAAPTFPINSTDRKSTRLNSSHLGI